MLSGSTDGTTVDTTLSTTTYQPVNGSFYSVGGTAGDAVVPDTGIPAAEANIDSVVEIVVPIEAEDDTVIDLSELSKFAVGIYENQVAAARDEAAAGGGVDPSEAVKGSTGVEDAVYLEGCTSTAAWTCFPVNHQKCLLVHFPRVRVLNRNHNWSVYLQDRRGVCYDSRSFHGIDDQIDVRSNEALTVEFNPFCREWRVVDTNSRG